MSRRKRAASHENHERWLISYSDFVTLLFAFFVVMFSASQVDKRKVGKMALAMQVAFQELGIFESSNTHVPLSQSQPLPFSTVQMVDNAALTTVLGRVASSPEGAPAAATTVINLTELRQRLERALAPQLAKKIIGLRVSHDTLILSLREVGFFDSGSATLRPEAEPVVARIARILQTIPCFLRFEGHTDNVPIHSAAFPSNWELSTARATNMVRLFITQFGFDPTHLSAAGYSKYHPVASNTTAEGRAMNRRVDIVILPIATWPIHSVQAATTTTLSPLAPHPASPGLHSNGPKITPE